VFMMLFRNGCDVGVYLIAALHRPLNHVAIESFFRL
jgi:hypothetical protein